MDLLTFPIEVFQTRWPNQTCTPILARELTRDRHVDQFTPSFDHSKVLARNLEKLVLNKKQTKVRLSHIQIRYMFTRSFSRPSLDKTQNKTTTHALTLDTHALVDMNLGL